MKKGIKIDISGKIFGKLTVLYSKEKNHRGSYIWECQCECGNKKIAIGDDLRSGHTKSCGCLKSPNDQDYIEIMKKRLTSLSHEEGECWIWKETCRQRFGYGFIQWRKQQMAAHRASWIAWKGKIPKGLFVLHKCDNPSCINPDHLFLGTQKDNMQDMYSKGRGNIQAKIRKGEDSQNSKLTEKDVLEIRKLFKEGTNSIGELAKIYGVEKCTIKDVKSYRSWKHLP